MAKKVEGYIKLQIPAGKATPAPPVGPALGQPRPGGADYRNRQNAIGQPNHGSRMSYQKAVVIFTH